MKYIWCNIKSFFINKKLIFLLTVFSVICSCVMIHFSYGLFQNYQLKKQYDLSDKREIVLTLQDNYEEVPDNELNDDEFYLRVPEKLDAYVTVDLLKKFVAEFGNSFEEKLKYIEMTAVVDELPFRLMFTIKDGVITKSDEFEKEVEDNAMLESGRYFTEEEYRAGEKVAICWDYLHWNIKSSPVSNRMAVDKETLHIQGKDYKIIAYGIIDRDRPTIPVTSLEGTTPFTGEMVFHFRKPIRQEQYDTVSEKTEKVLGELAVLEPAELPDDDAVYLYNTIIMITVFIALVSAINFAILYRYILTSRKQSRMVYRICGMNFFQVVFLYLGECVVLTVPAYLAGIFLFENILLKQISGHYEYMSGSYDAFLYLALFAVYFLVSLLVLSFMIVHALKSDAELDVRGGFQ